MEKLSAHDRLKYNIINILNNNFKQKVTHSKLML